MLRPLPSVWKCGAPSRLSPWGIVAAVAAIFALEFAAAAILIAAWNTHPVVAAVSIAAGFLLLALAAAWAVRRCTR